MAAAYRAYYYVRRAAAHLVVVNDGFHIFFVLARRGLTARLPRQMATAALSVDRIIGSGPAATRTATTAAVRLRGVLPVRLRRLLPIGGERETVLVDGE